MTSKYAAAHANPNGPGDARPTALQIIKDENLRDALQDKVILITGCSSGIGIETVRALSTTGATIYATARSLPKARAALGPSLLSSPRLHLLPLDLTSLASVRACAARFLALSPNKLDILIPNAGVMATPTRTLTPDGFETQLGVNYLAHFLLFWLLKPALLASAPSRLVFVSSSAHRLSPLRLDDPNFAAPGATYDPWIAYGQSKTALIVAAAEIERRYGGTARGLHALSLHPGSIATGLQAHVSAEEQEQWATIPGLAKTWKSAEQGAATTVWAVVARELEGKGGLYLEDCGVAGPWDEGTGMAGPGYAEWVGDGEGAARLWEVTVGMLGLEGEGEE